MISAYYYDSSRVTDVVEEALAHFGAADGNVTDTAGWDAKERRELYFSTVMPAATENGRAIGDDLQDDGDITFEPGVLLTADGDVRVDEDALAFLREQT